MVPKFKKYVQQVGCNFLLIEAKKWEILCWKSSIFFFSWSFFYTCYWTAYIVFWTNKSVFLDAQLFLVELRYDLLRLWRTFYIVSICQFICLKSRVLSIQPFPVANFGTVKQLAMTVRSAGVLLGSKMSNILEKRSSCPVNIIEFFQCTMYINRFY